MIRLFNGIIYDPAQKIDGELGEIWIEDDKIIEKPSAAAIKKFKNAGELEEIDLEEEKPTTTNN